MRHRRLLRTSDVSVLVLAALLAGAGVSYAETFPFRVAYDDVPGADEIESGNLVAAIAILEAQSNARDTQDRGGILATLCGAYVLNASLDKASATCDAAVALSPSKLAYNNRGVLRVHSGDLPGAREDFDRARPEHLNQYLEYLRTKDIGLIADGNFDLLEELSAKKSRARVNTAFAVSAPSIENILN
jgi:hypothetical protein